MNEAMNNLFMAVITLAVPTVSALAIQAVERITDQLAAQTENETIDRVLAEIADAVRDAVAATSQTYVDALKAAGSFGEAAQRQALGMALAACLGSLSQSARDFIQGNFGDAETYLTGRIEAEVKRQKLAA